jgi:dTDP-4-dehydrorhamnose 3,5-epimerase
VSYAKRTWLGGRLRPDTIVAHDTLQPAEVKWHLKTELAKMAIHVTDTAIPEVKIVEPTVFGDRRGSFFESFNAQEFNEVVAQGFEFVQDNHSRSTRSVLRGLHYQIQRPQGKLVRVIAGEVFDVAVDLRLSSPTFGKWVGINLSAKNHRQLWIPPGFAHGFIVVSASAEFLYKTTDYWFPEYERSLLWCDPEVNIDWPIEYEPVIAPKDAAGRLLYEAECYP